MVRCQDCIHLKKVSYRVAMNVHHATWERGCGDGPCQYEATIADRDCNKFDRKIGQK